MLGSAKAANHATEPTCGSGSYRPKAVSRALFLITCARFILALVRWALRLRLKAALLERQ
jgi:hypothetical protein